MKIEPSLVIAFPLEGTNSGFGINGTFFYGINNNIDLTFKNKREPASIIKCGITTNVYL